MRSFALTCAAVIIALSPAYGQDAAKPGCKPTAKPPCKVKGKEFVAPDGASTDCAVPKPAPAAQPASNLFNRGEPLSSNDCAAGYNLAARIDTQDWDFFIGGAFTFWSSSQDGMDLAVSSSFNTGAIPTFFRPAQAVTLFQKFSYKPGFKLMLGGGTDFDKWAYAAHYTWFRSQTSVHSDKPPTPPTGVGATGDWIIQNWMPRTTNINALSLNSSWNLGMDMVDVQLSRPYYLGTNLTLEPFFGAQGGWIRQALRLSYVAIPSNTGTNPVPHNPIVSHNHSHCWGIGPRVGVNFNWLVMCGFRMMGSAEGNLLYTSYKNISQRVDAADGSAGANAQSIQISNLGVVRPNAGLNMGIGWGMYADRNRWHFDLSATYDYYVYFSQNMMRYLADLNGAKTGASAGDLFLQGLTATARFDF